MSIQCTYIQIRETEKKSWNLTRRIMYRLVTPNLCLRTLAQTKSLQSARCRTWPIDIISRHRRRPVITTITTYATRSRISGPTSPIMLRLMAAISISRSLLNTRRPRADLSVESELLLIKLECTRYKQHYSCQSENIVISRFHLLFTRFYAFSNNFCRII